MYNHSCTVLSIQGYEVHTAYTVHTYLSYRQKNYYSNDAMCVLYEECEGHMLVRVLLHTGHMKSFYKSTPTTWKCLCRSGEVHVGSKEWQHGQTILTFRKCNDHILTCIHRHGPIWGSKHVQCDFWHPPIVTMQLKLHNIHGINNRNAPIYTNIDMYIHICKGHVWQSISCVLYLKTGVWLHALYRSCVIVCWIINYKHVDHCV